MSTRKIYVVSTHGLSSSHILYRQSTEIEDVNENDKKVKNGEVICGCEVANGKWIQKIQSDEPEQHGERFDQNETSSADDEKLFLPFEMNDVQILEELKAPMNFLVITPNGISLRNSPDYEDRCTSEDRLIIGSIIRAHEIQGEWILIETGFWVPIIIGDNKLLQPVPTSPRLVSQPSFINQIRSTDKLPPTNKSKSAPHRGGTRRRSLKLRRGKDKNQPPTLKTLSAPSNIYERPRTLPMTLPTNPLAPEKNKKNTKKQKRPKSLPRSLMKGKNGEVALLSQETPKAGSYSWLDALVYTDGRDVSGDDEDEVEDDHVKAEGQQEEQDDPTTHYIQHHILISPTLKTIESLKDLSSDERKIIIKNPPKLPPLPPLPPLNLRGRLDRWKRASVPKIDIFARRNSRDESSETDTTPHADYGGYTPSSEGSTVKITKKRVHKFFKNFDADGDGSVSVTELLQSLNEMGFDIDMKETLSMVESVDKDGDYYLDIDEFKKLLEMRGDIAIAVRAYHAATKHKRKKSRSRRNSTSSMHVHSRVKSGDSAYDDRIDAALKEYLDEKLDERLQSRHRTTSVKQNVTMDGATLLRIANHQLSVGRIVDQNDSLLTQGRGTGFVFAPGIFLTNSHVIPTQDGFSKYRILFPTRDPNKKISFSICSVSPFYTSPKSEIPNANSLDYSAFKLMPDESNVRCPPPLVCARNAVWKRGQTVMTFGYPDGVDHIQHNQGEISLSTDFFIGYDIKTQKGCSGSPVFNNLGEVIALHRAEGDGISIVAILKDLEKRNGFLIELEHRRPATPTQINSSHSDTHLGVPTIDNE